MKRCAQIHDRRDCETLRSDRSDSPVLRFAGHSAAFRDYRRRQKNVFGRRCETDEEKMEAVSRIQSRACSSFWWMFGCLAIACLIVILVRMFMRV